MGEAEARRHVTGPLSCRQRLTAHCPGGRALLFTDTVIMDDCSSRSCPGSGEEGLKGIDLRKSGDDDLYSWWLVPVHEARKQGEGGELAWEAMIRALVTHARFAQGVVRTGFLGAGLHDGDKIVDGFMAFVGKHVLGGLAQFGDAGLHQGMPIHARGALRGFARVAGSAVGFHHVHASEPGLGEGFLPG
jgi:hypothetical protein